ncbi:MAG: hypothetical protein OQK76_01480, partial [Gammaproteobacteria bacterium]|nr:hypothetical protein [Gammaproteobacteria bacterium]
MSRLKELLNEIRELEVRIADEISKEADEFGYTIKRGKVLFDEEISNSHRQLTKTLGEFLGECSWPGLLVSPVVYSLIIPVLIFDVFVFVYQLVCF